MTTETPDGASSSPERKRLRGRLLRAGLAIAVLALAASCVACSPIYVIKAGIAEMQILRARRDIPEMLNDPTIDPVTRGKLSFVFEARRFAANELGIDVGDAYTMFTQLDRDTLALVVSAAHKDRLVPKTWWFPIVGRMPYKGFFSLEEATNARDDLEEDGLDAYMRPTAAFSTLGWFNDPILSTVLRADDVDVVETVLHELSHQHLFVGGAGTFNESFATFVGRVGAVRFFCTREGSGPDSVKCLRAVARWRDFQRFSVFLGGFVEELERIYDDASNTFEDKVSLRETVFAEALARFAQDDDATAIHHVAGHEVGVARAAQCARLHHLARARADVALDHHLRAADRDARDGAGVAADHDRAIVHVVGHAPTDVVVDLEAGIVAQTGAEVAGRTAHPHRNRVDQADADVVARVGVEDLDVLAARAGLADALVGLADRNVG